MATSAPRRCGTALVAVAAALIVWGAVGFHQGLHSGFSGGVYDPDYRVPGVRRGSPAAKAGFQAGDRVISVEGRPVEELGMESRWPLALAPKAGQSRRFVVERKGQRLALDMAYPAPFPRAVNTRIGAVLVGMAFLGCGLWAYLTVRTPPALRLAHIGLAAAVSVSLGLGPNLGSWNGIQHHLGAAANVLTVLLLARFFLTFPKPKRVSESRLAWWAMYGAWGCLLIFLAAELILHPALYYTTGSVAGPLTLAYIILALAALAHTLVRSPGTELRDSGVTLILPGLGAALAGAAAVFAFGAGLPGWASALPVALIPLALALAVGKQARLKGQ